MEKHEKALALAAVIAFVNDAEDLDFQKLTTRMVDLYGSEAVELINGLENWEHSKETAQEAFNNIIDFIFKG